MRFFTQDWNLGQELFVHLPLPDGRAHQDPSVGVSVEAPELDLGRRLNGRGSWGPIDLKKETEPRELAS